MIVGFSPVGILEYGTPLLVPVNVWLVDRVIPVVRIAPASQSLKLALLRSDRDIKYNESLVDLSISEGVSVENDFCENAEPISIGTTVNSNFSRATYEKEYDFSQCISDRGGSFASFPDMWYTFVGNGKRLVARLENVCERNMDTGIAILSGNCNRTNVACLAGTVFCPRNRFQFQTVKGTSYLVLVKSLNLAKIVKITIATCGPFQLGFFCPEKLQRTIRSFFRGLLGF
jgi:hypothetical protein